MIIAYNIGRDCYQLFWKTSSASQIFSSASYLIFQNLLPFSLRLLVFTIKKNRCQWQCKLRCVLWKNTLKSCVKKIIWFYTREVWKRFSNQSNSLDFDLFILGLRLNNNTLCARRIILIFINKHGRNFGKIKSGLLKNISTISSCN